MGEVRCLFGDLDELDVGDETHVVVVDGLHQVAEHLEALSLPRDERVGLRDAAQMDALAQISPSRRGAGASGGR